MPIHLIILITTYTLFFQCIKGIGIFCFIPQFATFMSSYHLRLFCGLSLALKPKATDTQILNQRYRYISAEHTLAIYHSQPFVIVTSSAWLMKGVKKRRMGLRRGRGSRRVVIESAVKLQSRLRFHYAAP